MARTCERGLSVSVTRGLGMMAGEATNYERTGTENRRAAQRQLATGNRC